jgi:hypothetical protein
MSIMKKIVLKVVLVFVCGISFSQNKQYDYTILLTGASFAESSNGWFELGCERLNAKAINRAVGGEWIGNTVDRMVDGRLYSKDELETIDALVIMHAHDQNVYNRSQVKANYLDYPLPVGNGWNNFAAHFDHAIKRYAADCYNLKFDPKSSYYDKPCGKPAIVVICTSWHPGRVNYDTSVRQLTELWGIPLIEFDMNIGFSNKELHPVTKKQSNLLYSPDTQSIGGVEYGWHPLRGKNQYIQQRMGAIFAGRMKRVLPYKYIEPNTKTLEHPIHIDFGTISTTDPKWNNLTDEKTGMLSNLIDMKGNYTGISIEINDAFSGTNTSGPVETTTSIAVPSTASQDAFFGYSADPTGTFLLSKLNADQRYTISLFASRINSSDNRQTALTVTGKTEETAYVNASDNTENLATVSNISPSDDGQFVITVKAGPGNTNSSKFYYANLLQIAPYGYTSSEPARLPAIGIFPNPIKDELNVQSGRILQRMDIIDVSGKIIKTFYPSTACEKLDISCLHAGLYILRFLEKDNTVSFSRILKE